MLGVLAFLLIAGSMTSWFRRMKAVRVPEDRRAYVACWAGGACLGILALTQGPGWIGGVPAALAVLAGSLFSLLVFISPQKVADHAVAIGERLRDFTAQDANGELFTMSSAAGKPVLLKFFRGHW